MTELDIVLSRFYELVEDMKAFKKLEHAFIISDIHMYTAESTLLFLEQLRNEKET